MDPGTTSGLQSLQKNLSHFLLKTSKVLVAYVHRSPRGQDGFGDSLEITMHNKPVALVTGANKGIGLQMAKDLAAHGFTVLVGSRNLESAETTAKSVEADARALQLNVTNQASIAAAAEQIRNEIGRLDALVNNAGASLPGKPGRMDSPLGW